MATGTVITPTRMLSNPIGNRKEVYVDIDAPGAGSAPWSFDSGLSFVEHVQPVLRGSNAVGPSVFPNSKQNDAASEDDASDAGWVTYDDVANTVALTFRVIGRA